MSNTFLDKDGNPVGPFDFNTTLGRKNAALVRSFALSNEDLAAINAIATALAGTITVTGTFFPSTQPVSIASLPALSAGSAVIGKVGVDQTSPGTTNGFSISHIGGTAAASGNGTTGAGTLRVAIASDNSAFQINANQNGIWNITNISGAISLPTGASTAGNQTTLNTAVGAQADAAVANGSSGSAMGYWRAIKDAVTDTTSSSKVVSGYDEWETVAASQTDQVLGATGATGDRLSHVLIIPATTSPGAVSIKDGAGSAITIFTGGASSVSTLVPFAVPLGLKSLAGAWKVTTGTNVSAIGVGDFT